MINDKISDVGINIVEKATVIWNVADMLRGPFKPHEYGLVILPMTVVKRFHDCLLPTHDNVLVKSIWSEIENLRPDISNKQGRDEIEKCAGYLLLLDDETAVILINEAFLFDSIRKNFCWVEVLIHEITHYRDYKNNLGIFGHNTYESMLSCCSFWYWTEFHARYKGTCQMLNYVNRMPDDERRKYETDMMERLDCAPDFIRSDADKKTQCYRFMHLLGDIAAYNEKGFTIKSGAIEKIFPDYLGYIDILKSKDQIVDINFLIILQYNLENEMNVEC